MGKRVPRAGIRDREPFTLTLGSSLTYYLYCHNIYYAVVA